MFTKAIYGACVWHVKINLKNKFKSKSVISIFNEAVRAYKISEFTAKFFELECRFPHVHKFLMDVGVERWVRALFHDDKYNIMTSNIVEALNAVLRKAREYLLLLLLDAIVDKMSEWFNNRCIMADNLTSPLMYGCEKILRYRCLIAGTLVAIRINENEWTIQGNECDTVVDLQLMTCTCKQFYLEKLPCVYAVKAASVIGADIYYDCCSVFYSSAFWKYTNEESIYHVPPQVYWEIPEDVLGIMVLPPYLKEYHKRERPRTNRFHSHS
ncbi:hypothetical protein UlMin_013189 [Ulmus minor]